MPDRPAHDAAEYIAPALPRGEHSVGDQERARTDMIRQNAQRAVQPGVPAKLRASNSFRVTDDSGQRIGFVVAVYTLEDGCDAFEACARIHGRFGELLQCTIRLLVELHEHQIPQLDITLIDVIL